MRTAFVHNLLRIDNSLQQNLVPYRFEQNHIPLPKEVSVLAMSGHKQDWQLRPPKASHRSHRSALRRPVRQNDIDKKKVCLRAGINQLRHALIGREWMDDVASMFQHFFKSVAQSIVVFHQNYM